MRQGMEEQSSRGKGSQVGGALRSGNVLESCGEQQAQGTSRQSSVTAEV